MAARRNLLNFVSLEVPDTLSGHYNLVTNPTGALGSFGYQSPISGSAVVAGSTADYLVYTPAAGVANYFTTESMVIPASTYVLAAFDVLGGGCYFTAQYVFLKADGTVVSTSTASTIAQASTYANGAVAPHTQRYSLAPAQAPSGAVRVRIRWNIYSNSSSANPTSTSQTLLFTRVALQQSVVDTFGWTRTNLLGANGAFANSTQIATWTAAFGWAITQNTSDAAPGGGTGCAQVTRSSGSSIPFIQSGYFTVTAGTFLAMSAWVKSTSTPGATALMQLTFYYPDGSSTSTSVSPVATWTNSTWVKWAGTVSVPQGATSARVAIVMSSSFTATWYVDNVLVEQVYDVDPQSATSNWWYPSGSPTLQGVYDWLSGFESSGNPVVVTQAVGYVSASWIKLLSSSSSVTWTRDEWDVATFSAVIQSGTSTVNLPSGTPIRVMVQNGQAGSLVRPMFTGFTTDWQQVRNLTSTNPATAYTLTVTAVDNMQRLAAADRVNTVAAISSLPWVLEGCGVPWNCDGTIGQITTTPTTVAVNAGSSAADQVALTRDSNAGYSWIDTRGVVNVFSAANMVETVKAVLDETTYTDDIVAGLDTTRVVNDATITLNVYSATSGLTGQEDHGPYVDQNSIDLYGDHPQTYTVAGLTAAQCDSLGALIVANNATPTTLVQSLSVPLIRDDVDIALALLDIYDLVEVKNTSHGIDENHRVVSITHTLTADADHHEWQMDLSFVGDGTAAVPDALPDPTVAAQTSVASRIAYTPVLTASTTNPTHATGTGFYHFDGQGYTDITIRIDFTGTAGGSGTFAVSLPSNIAPLDGNEFRVDGWATCAAFNGSPIKVVGAYSSGTLTLRYLTTGAIFAPLTNAAPGAWASGDWIQFSLVRFAVA